MKTINILNKISRIISFFECSGQDFPIKVKSVDLTHKKIIDESGIKLNNIMIAGYYDVYNKTIYLERRMVESPRVYNLVCGRKLFDVLLHEFAHYKYLGHGREFHQYLKYLKQNYSGLKAELPKDRRVKNDK